MSKQLVFVSGLGDTQHKFYDFVERQWKSSGFIPHVYLFGWDDRSASFSVKLSRFLAFLDKLPENDELYLVGISAGGPVVVSAFVARPKIKKLITVDSPFVVRPHHVNKLLIAAIESAETAFAQFTPEMKYNFYSMTGWRDNLVSALDSRLEGVRLVRVFGWNHVTSIFFATVIAKRRLKKFLLRA